VCACVSVYACVSVCHVCQWLPVCVLASVSSVLCMELVGVSSGVGMCGGVLTLNLFQVGTASCLLCNLF